MQTLLNSLWNREWNELSVSLLAKRMGGSGWSLIVVVPTVGSIVLIKYIFAQQKLCLGFNLRSEFVCIDS